MANVITLIGAAQRLPSVRSVEGALLGAINKSKGMALASVKDMWTWAASNKANAFVTLSTMATLGISMSDFIADTDVYKALASSEEGDRSAVAEAMKIGQNYRETALSAAFVALDTEVEKQKPKTTVNIGVRADKDRLKVLVQWGSAMGFGKTAEVWTESFNRLEELLALPDAVRADAAYDYLPSLRP